ncbi:MAG: hypothetical protein U0Q10_13390 [Dermatophilaceae bacterium]
MPAFGTRQDVVNVKLDTPGGSVRAGVRGSFAACSSVAHRRGFGLRFLNEEGVDRLIAASGGLFRDLLRLVRGTLLNARGLPATEQDLARAEMQVREDYTMTFAKEHLTLLSEVDRTKELFVKREQSADEAELVSLGAILRYPNDQTTWFAVHPLLLGVIARGAE